MLAALEARLVRVPEREVRQRGQALGEDVQRDAEVVLRAMTDTLIEQALKRSRSAGEILAVEEMVAIGRAAQRLR